MDLPESWMNVVSNEILDIRDGTHDTPKYVDEKTYPLVTSKNLKKGKIDFDNVKYISTEDFLQISRRSKVDIGDVLFAMIGTIGNPVVVKKEPTYAIKNIGLFKNPKKIINSELLKYYLDSLTFSSQIEEKQFLKGTTQKFIPLGNLRKIEIPLPPLPEQRAIVSKIELLFSELDNGIANLKLAQEQLKVYRQAVLKKGFEGELTKDKVTMVQKRIGDFAELITKGASPKWQGFNYVNDESQLLFITSENVREGFIDLTKKKFLPLEFNEKQKRSILKKNDVLFNIVGASIGRAAIFNLDVLSNINQAVAIIRLSNDLNNLYLTYFLNAEIAKQDYLSKVVDVARANLSLTDMKNFIIPYCSLFEQQAIVQEIETRLSICDKVEQDIEDNLVIAEALRQSILKKAFEGKLLNERELEEVLNADDWEPAEVLLKRIRAERVKK